MEKIQTSSQPRTIPNTLTGSLDMEGYNLYSRSYRQKFNRRTWPKGQGEFTELINEIRICIIE